MVRGVSISWSSSNAAIATNGVVTRGSEDVNVTLTATLTYKGIERVLTFDVIVRTIPSTKLSSPHGLVVQTDRKSNRRWCLCTRCWLCKSIKIYLVY